MSRNENNPGEEFLASILSFSPDGKQILALTNTQMIYIHSIINKSLIYKYSYTKKNRICSLVWHADSFDEIIFCDTNGQMGQIKPTFKESQSDQVTSTNTTTTTVANKTKAVVKEVTKETKKESTKEKKKKPAVQDDELEMDELMELLGDNDDDSNQESVKSSEIGGKKKTKSSKSSELKHQNSPKKRKRLSDDEFDESSRDSEVKSSKTGDDDDDQNNVDDDIEEMNDDDIESMEKLKERAYKLAKKEALLETALESKGTELVIYFYINLIRIGK